MSIFASAKWDSDSDFDSNSEALKTITNNAFNNNSVDDASKNKSSRGPKTVKYHNRNHVNSNKLYSTNRQSKLEIQKNVKTSNRINSTKMNIETLKQNGKYKIRKPTTDSEQKNVIVHTTKAKVLPNQTKNESKDKKIDTALRKVALYKKLKEIQKSKEDTKQLNIQTNDQEPRKNKHREKLFQILERKKEEKSKTQNVLSNKVLTLKQRMEEKLKAARFRFLNEQIYNTNSKEAQKIFKTDPDAFKAYHEGYKQQVKKWPLNPLDVVIKTIKKLPRTLIIADFGCGEAKLAKSVHQKVYSFDLVAFDDSVIACDMAHVPLADGSVDLVVFCLSLMGTNLGDYLMEANRILKIGGTMKIVEVVSRFDNIDEFTKSVQCFGFKFVWKDVTHNYFYFMDFKKEMNVRNKKKLSSLKLNIQPCSYKKR